MPDIFKKIGRFAPVALLVGLPLIGFWQRWNAYDFWQLRNYQAPAAVVALATDTTMKPDTRRLFYVNHPSIEDKATFRGHCATGEQTIVLGCFIAFKGIYLQEIPDERLKGVTQVTAAHETLHAAYQRLSPSEKKHVNQMVEAEFAKLSNDRIKNTIEDYKKAGADIDNELHSILGTEVGTLSPELESYYSRYFSDRAKIVAFSEQYEAAFTSRKNQVADYDAQLTSIKKDIDAGNANLEAQQHDLDASQAQLNQLLASKRTNEYNAAVPGYNAKVQAYNNQVSYVRGLIDRYNALVKIRNDVAIEEGELVKAIDSRPNTVDGN